MNQRPNEADDDWWDYAIIAVALVALLLAVSCEVRFSLNVTPSTTEAKP